jgi:hypothetical protein
MRFHVAADGDDQAEDFDRQSAKNECGAQSEGREEHESGQGEKESGWKDQQSGKFHELSLFWRFNFAFRRFNFAAGIPVECTAPPTGAEVCADYGGL